MPQAPEVGNVYFEKSTGRIIIPQSDGSLVEYGGKPPIVITAAEVEDGVVSMDTVNALLELMTMSPTEMTTTFGEFKRPVYLEINFNQKESPVTLPQYLTCSMSNYIGEMIVLSACTSEFNGSSLDTALFSVQILKSNGAITVEKLCLKRSGSKTKVLAEDGTYVTLPSSITVDSALSETSTNPVQNKVIKAELEKLKAIVLPYNTLSNSAGLTSTMREQLDSHGDSWPVYFQQDGLFYPAAFFKTSSWGYKFIVLDCNGDGRLLVREFDSSGKRTSSLGMQFILSGDGTKVLADNGSYVSLPSQGLDGSRIFVANWARSVIQPVVGIALDILYPTDVSPVPGRDYAIIQNGGRFGPITQPVPDGEYVMPLDKAVNINGDSLDYEWSGTSLRIGVRSGTTGETTWGNYVNLKGAEYQSMVTTSVTMDPSDNSSVTSAITSMIESNTDYATIEISNTTGGTYSLPTSILQGFLLSRGKKVTYLYFHNNTDCTINFTKSAVYHKFPKSGLSIPAKTAIEVSIAYTGGVFVFTVSEELEV